MSAPDSKNEAPCDCRFLVGSAADPDVPIEFIQETGEFVFAYGTYNRIFIYFCPICGGKAPKSWPEARFHKIPDTEVTRLRELTKDIVSKDDALRILGIPDNEEKDEYSTTVPKGDEAPRVEMMDPVLSWTQYSGVADIIVVVRPSGPVKVFFSSKPK